MAYNEFAYFYDEFNGEADYDALYSHIHSQLEAHGIRDGILADLGCGTGELTLMLTQAGYDMIGIDQSEEMLCVVRDKAEGLLVQLGLNSAALGLVFSCCSGRTCSSWTCTAPSGVRCLPLTPSTISRIWTRPLRMPGSLWKRAACSCLT